MVYAVKRSFPIKIAYFIFILMLAFMLVTGFPCMEVKANPFALPLFLTGAGASASVLSIACGVGLLLVAAGVTYLTVTELKKAIDDYYISRSESVKQQIVNGVDGAKYNIPDQLWSDVRGYVQGKYNTESTSVSIDIPYKLWTTPTGDNLYYTYGFSSTKDINDYLWSSKLLINGHVIEPFIASSTSTTDNYKLLLDGYLAQSGIELYNIDGQIAKTYTHITYNIECQKGTRPVFINYVKNTGELYCAYIWKTTSGTLGCYNPVSNSSNNYYLKTNVAIPTPETINYQASDVINDISWDIDVNGNRQIALTEDIDSIVGKTYSDVLSIMPSPTYTGNWTGSFKDCTLNMGSYVFEGSGTIICDMDYTLSGTWVGTWSWTNTGARQWTGTYTNTENLTWTGTATEIAISGNPSVDMEETNGLLGSIQGAITGAIVGKLTDIWTWMQEFWTKILEKMQQALQPVSTTLENIYTRIADKAQSIVDAITGAVATTAEPDLEPITKNYKLPDFVFGLFSVIKACIRLVIRACVFLATIVAIQPDGSLLNGNALSGLDFFRNQNIPVLNVTVWNMFSGMMTLVISLSVVRKVRSNFSEWG